MAQWTITHSCGHEETHQLYGPGTDRSRKAAWLETTLCSECYRIELVARREAESAEAIASNADAGLSALTGSAKQIAWAESIRARLIPAMREMLAAAIAAAPDDANVPEVQEIAARIEGETSAHQWIEWRDLEAGQLIRRLYQAAHAA